MDEGLREQTAQLIDSNITTVILVSVFIGLIKRIKECLYKRCHRGVSFPSFFSALNFGNTT